MDQPQMTLPDLLQLLGQATADAFAWRRQAEHLAAELARARAELAARTAPPS